MQELIATPLIACAVCALLMPLLNRAAVRLGFVDMPNARKIHSHPVPLLGGVGVYLGVIAALLASGPMDLGLGLMMAASFLVMALGVVDDRLDLNSRYRLILQLLVALGLSVCGVRFHFFPIELLDHVVTVLWIVGVINAMNCLDCADGAAGGTCLVVFGALAAISLGHGRLFVGQACLAGAGAVLGFLFYNAPPARVFLGLMMAVLAILANPIPGTAWQLPLAPFALFVPVFDIIWVHYRRYQAGIQSARDLLSSNGKDHLPHRLMERGLSKRGCMLLVAVCSLMAAGTALGLLHGLWMGAGIATIALVSLLWHLEEGAGIFIREDGVAIFRLQESPAEALAPLSAAEPARGSLSLCTAVPAPLALTAAGPLAMDDPRP
ncbi:MAG: undecaprenyl/decaprenyl-phosphate alpha-N-acetylglucosaminyl 1-phosphate transferase [Armatimonadetes bacterium]|nr:undecaprenyl/decaprenyl-phosphate alpha-N-acetylglucosaminyl 1-phosphate transferase [Armatimonadota bacterium]